MTYDDFNSVQFRKIKCKNNTPLDDEYGGFIMNKKNVLTILEKYKDVSEYLPKYDEIRFGYLPESEFDILKKTDFSYRKNRHRKTYIYYFDEEYFKLYGKKYRNVRNAVNKYTDKITIKSKCNDVSEVIDLMKLWKKQRKDRYYMFITSGEEYFLNTFYNDNDFISRFYYDNDVLIGYSIYERLENGLFNSFFRKCNLEYSHLSEFIDFKSFEYVYKQYGNFYLNIGDDGGDKKLKDYKNANFNIAHVFDLYDIVLVNKTKKKKDIVKQII